MEVYMKYQRMHARATEVNCSEMKEVVNWVLSRYLLYFTHPEPQNSLTFNLH